MYDPRNKHQQTTMADVLRSILADHDEGWASLRLLRISLLIVLVIIVVVAYVRVSVFLLPYCRILLNICSVQLRHERSGNLYMKTGFFDFISFDGGFS